MTTGRILASTEYRQLSVPKRPTRLYWCVSIGVGLLVVTSSSCGAPDTETRERPEHASYRRALAAATSEVTALIEPLVTGVRITDVTHTVEGSFVHEVDIALAFQPVSSHLLRDRVEKRGVALGYTTGEAPVWVERRSACSLYLQGEITRTVGSSEFVRIDRVVIAFGPSGLSTCEAIVDQSELQVRITG